MITPQRKTAIVAHVFKKIASGSQPAPSRHQEIVSHVIRKVTMNMSETSTAVGAGAGALLGGAAGAYSAPVDPRTGKRNRGRQIGQAIIGAIAGGAIGGGVGYGANRLAGAGDRSSMAAAKSEYEMSKARPDERGPAAFAASDAEAAAKSSGGQLVDAISGLIPRGDGMSGAGRRGAMADEAQKAREGRSAFTGYSPEGMQ